MPVLQGAAVGLAEEADLEELIRQKEALVAERDGQVQAIVALRGEVRTGEGRAGGWHSDSQRAVPSRAGQAAAAKVGAAAAGCCSRCGCAAVHQASCLLLHPQLADFAEHMRAAEAEKAGLEAEIQVASRLHSWGVLGTGCAPGGIGLRAALPGHCCACSPAVVVRVHERCPLRRLPRSRCGTAWRSARRRRTERSGGASGWSGR